MTKPLALAKFMVAAVLAMALAGADTPPMPATAPSTQPAKQLTLDLGDKLTLKLVQIPAGKFTMGSPESETGRMPNEVQHEVTISKPLYMGATLVTRDQFAAFVKDSGYKTDAEKDGWSSDLEIENGKLSRIVGNRVDGCCWNRTSFEQKGDEPVVQISWNDAKAFCDWLSKKSGKTVTLPTEAQWEYACRAGSKTAFPWGDNPDDGKGFVNGADQSLRKFFATDPAGAFFTFEDGFVFTSPVTSLKPNAFGLYDMTGNAFQWCLDFSGPYGVEPVTDPTGPADGTRRVVRGGTWNNEPRVSRAAFRYAGTPSHRNVDYSFRVVVTSAD